MASISAQTFRNGSLRVSYKSGKAVRWIEVDIGRKIYRLYMWYGMHEDQRIIIDMNCTVTMPRKMAMALYIAAETEGLLDEDMPDIDAY